MHLDRAQEQGDIDLLPTNWRLLYLHALIASSKLLYDVAICNDDFAPIFPKLSLEHMLECELAFMRLTQWSTRASGDAYAEFTACFDDLVATSRRRDRCFLCFLASKHGS